MGELKTVPGKIKSFVLDSLSEPSDEGRIVKGWASKPVVDRGREKVLTEAFTKTMPKFMDNPIMLYMHSMMTPIGTWTDYKLSNEGLFVTGEIVEGVPQADYVWTLVKRRVLRSLSIGFMELDGEFSKADNAYIIKDLELYETSIVSIPMNQDALITLDSGGKFLNIQPMDLDTAGFTMHPPDRKAVISYAKYATQDPGTPWDGGAARNALRSWAAGAGGKTDMSKYRLGFTYVISGEEDLLGSYKLPHHTVSNGHLVTNLSGCRAAIGALAGARGGVSLPDSERRGAYNHLARHIEEDFDADVPSYDELAFMSEREVLKMFGNSPESESHIFTAGAPVTEPKEDDIMTPEQEQKLNDAVAATEALKAQVEALQTKVATQETQLAESNTKVGSIETKLDDAQICLTEMVQLFENAEDEESADENHPEQ